MSIRTMGKTTTTFEQQEIYTHKGLPVHFHLLVADKFRIEKGLVKYVCASSNMWLVAVVAKVEHDTIHSTK